MSSSSNSDYYVAVPLNVAVLYARQDTENTEHHTLDEITTWTKEKNIHRDVIDPTGLKLKTPSVKRGGRKSTKQKMTVPLHTFKRDNGNVIIPIGGHYGLLKQAVHRIGKAKKGNYYRAEQWDLIYPFSLDHTEDAKIKLDKDDQLSVEVMLGKINRSGQDAAYVQFAWQKITDVMVPVILEINRICPIPIEEIRDTLHGLVTIPFGPNKHGKARLDDSLVKEFLTFDEAKAYLESFSHASLQTPRQQD